MLKCRLSQLAPLENIVPLQMEIVCFVETKDIRVSYVQLKGCHVLSVLREVIFLKCVGQNSPLDNNLRMLR